jgi:hypothetical protein
MHKMIRDAIYRHAVIELELLAKVSKYRQQRLSTDETKTSQQTRAQAQVKDGEVVDLTGDKPSVISYSSQLSSNGRGRKRIKASFASENEEEMVRPAPSQLAQSQQQYSQQQRDEERIVGRDTSYSQIHTLAKLLHARLGELAL